MVAPTRTPQARGVKCDLCKKILATATWLDQTKLAKSVEDAQSVLNLIRKHAESECPCIPKSIENLLVGSTHFEIHRLVAKRLDAQVHRKQYDFYCEARQKATSDQLKHQNENINDCHDNHTASRFKIFTGHNELKHKESSEQQLKHLYHAIFFWKLAIEDRVNPFNSKLALRLGLTHHVIYACYLFKFYKVVEYQLITANLLLNLFKSIDGVTTNAIIHANYLLIKTLIDCGQLHLARQCLKHATKISNYQDKTHYESILLNCVECELNILDSSKTPDVLDDLAKLAVIQPDDKLQHYYARTLAISIIIKYIHSFPARSDFCFEFYHAFRYICAIIRRCYESSFELVLMEKEVKQNHAKQSELRQTQILDHSWIRFAVCDFAFSTFDMLSSFYMRSGHPESLELLYNGLNLVAYRSGSCYWQSRMAAIGASFDLLCDKYEHAKSKLDAMSHIIGQTNDPHLMNLLRLSLEVSMLALFEQQKASINVEVALDLLKRFVSCHSSLSIKLSQIELYDCEANSSLKVTNNFDPNGTFMVLEGDLGYLGLKVLKIAISSMLGAGNIREAKNLISKLGTHLDAQNCKILEYNNCQIIMETMLKLANIDASEQLLLDAVGASQVFLKNENNLVAIESQLMMLNIKESLTTKSKERPRKTKPKKSIVRHSKRKCTYDVVGNAERNLDDYQAVRFFDTIETVINFSKLTEEELIVSYLRNTEPNPDYSMYRHCHELLFSFHLARENLNHDQLLYHFCESSTSNTMRYRWMMFEEQLSSPYDPMSSIRPSLTKHLSFSNSLLYLDKTVKSLIRTIPDDFKMTQLKYILEEKLKREHLLIVCFDNETIPFYIHAVKPVSLEENFFECSEKQGDRDISSMISPQLLSAKVERAKKTLFYSNYRNRFEVRSRVEKEIGVILHDLENDWLGPFRFLLCGKICNAAYSKFVQSLLSEIILITKNYSCSSTVALKCFLENAPLLNRDEFCQMVSSLFSCPLSSNETRDCYNKWLKSMESHLESENFASNKTSYLQTLTRGQLGLMLDKHLELMPFESLPIVRITKQGIFRVPSLRIFAIIANRDCATLKIDPNETAYMLDPANNLSKTRERFDSKLRAQTSWMGVISQTPDTDLLEQWFETRQVYIFIGHGAGTVYYNKLCKGRGLSAMSLVKPVSIVMGCSSGRVQAEGPRLESFGISWLFILKGAPSYVGLLWDVTDRDIDKFLDHFLGAWMGPKWETLNQQAESNVSSGDISISEAVAQARHVCQFKFLVGSTPVIYGLPIWCK